MSKPQRLNCLNNFVLSLVKGEVNRNVFIPIRIMIGKANGFGRGVNCAITILSLCVEGRVCLW